MSFFDFTGKLFNRFYKTGYFDLINSALGQYVIAYFFDVGNRKAPGWFKELFWEIFTTNFVEFLYDFQPDLIIHTHFLSLEIISAFKRRNIVSCLHITVVTDFDAHGWWACQPVEQFFVARDEGKQHLIHFGIPAENISVTGIPIMPAFNDVPSSKQCCNLLNIEGSRPVILLVSSGNKTLNYFKQVYIDFKHITVNSFSISLNLIYFIL